MWVPRHFEGDPAWDVHVIDNHPFGLLVSVDDGQPEATHVPMLIHPGDHDRAALGLKGSRVLGHLARANPQWRRIADGQRVLAVFLGPDGYVSPTQYADSPAAPTWNYVSVHVAGAIRLLHDRAEMMHVIDLTIDALESRREAPWEREHSRDYFERVLHGVVAFEISVVDVRSTYKLSQDQHWQRRIDVRDDALASPDADLRKLGEWMSNLMPPEDK